MFAGEGPPRRVVFVKYSEGDVRRMGYMYGGSRCRHGLEVGRLLELSMKLCGWIARCALCVGIVQAELGEEGD